MPAGATVRILDAGCGSAELVKFLHSSLAELRPDCRFEIYGFDISAWGSHSSDEQRREAIAYLVGCNPCVDWSERIASVPIRAPWPYPEAFFQAVVSNHVLEHVADQDLFFSELARVLAPGAFSAHLFPLRHYTYEGHIFVPFSHWFRNHDLAVSYLRLMHRLGFGRLNERGVSSRNSVADAVRQADWLVRFTCYRSKREILSAARQHGLRASFRYSAELYSAKLRSLLGRRAKYFYANPRSALWDCCSFSLLKYISSITLFLVKPEFGEHAELLFTTSESPRSV